MHNPIVPVVVVCDGAVENNLLCSETIKQINSEYPNISDYKYHIDGYYSNKDDSWLYYAWLKRPTTNVIFVLNSIEFEYLMTLDQEYGNCNNIVRDILIEKCKKVGI